MRLHTWVYGHRKRVHWKLTGRKIPCRTGESNLPQRHAGPTLYELSYIPHPSSSQKVECVADFACPLSQTLVCVVDSCCPPSQILEWSWTILLPIPGTGVRCWFFLPYIPENWVCSDSCCSLIWDCLPVCSRGLGEVCSLNRPWSVFLLTGCDCPLNPDTWWLFSCPTQTCAHCGIFLFWKVTAWSWRRRRWGGGFLFVYLSVRLRLCARIVFSRPAKYVCHWCQPLERLRLHIIPVSVSVSVFMFLYFCQCFCLCLLLCFWLFLWLCLWLFLWLCLWLFLWLFLTLFLTLPLTLSLTLFLTLSLTLSLTLFLALPLTLSLTLPLTLPLTLFLNLPLTLFLTLSLTRSLTLFLTLTLSLTRSLFLTLPLTVSDTVSDNVSPDPTPPHPRQWSVLRILFLLTPYSRRWGGIADTFLVLYVSDNLACRKKQLSGCNALSTLQAHLRKKQLSGFNALSTSQAHLRKKQLSGFNALSTSQAHLRKKQLSGFNVLSTSQALPRKKQLSGFNALSTSQAHLRKKQAALRINIVVCWHTGATTPIQHHLVNITLIQHHRKSTILIHHY